MRITGCENSMCKGPMAGERLTLKSNQMEAGVGGSEVEDETRHLIKVVKQEGNISDSCLLKLYAVGGRGMMGRPRGRLLHSSR